MPDERLLALLEAHLEGRLSEAEADELRAELRASASARRRFWQYARQHALIEDVLGESRGFDLARNALPATSPNTPAAPRRRHLLLWAGALAAALLLAAGLWLRRGGDETEVAFATVGSLAGDVRVCDAEGHDAQAAAGSSLSAGQTLRVGDEDSRAEILFADGIQVALSAGSALRLGEQEQDGKRIHLEAGAAQVTAPTTAPLVVTTDHARITASQTRFRLYREQESSRVEMQEGKVRLEGNAGDRWVDVPEGQFVVARDEPRPMQTQPLPLGQCRLRHTFLKAGDAACFSGDGGLLVTSHFARGLKAWGLHDGKLRASAQGTGKRAEGMAFVPDEGVMVADEGGAALWKVGEARPSRTPLREKGVRCSAVSADGRWLAQGTRDGEVALWEADHRTGGISLRTTLPVKPSRVVLSGDGSRVAVSKWAGDILVYDGRTGRDLSHHKLSRTPTPLALSADGRYVAAYANDDGLVLFDLRTGGRRDLWPGAGARVGCLSFSADGEVLLAGLDDGTLRAWASAQGRAVLVLQTGHQRVNKVAAAPDLSMLATVGDGDCVKVWGCELP